MLTASSRLLLLDNGTVALTYLSPSTIKVISSRRKRSLSGCLLINLDAPARILIHPEISILHRRAAVKDLLGPVVEGRVFLNAKVIANKIKSHVGHVAYRRNIPRAMPGGPDPIRFGQDRDFARRSKPAYLGNMHAYVVNKSSLNQRLPLVWVVEELAHGNRCRTVLPDLLEVGDVFR